MRDIVIGKLVDHTIDDDYEELSERLFGDGNCFSASEVRKRMYGMKSIIEAIERDGESEIQDEDMISLLDSKRIELQKERQKFFAAVIRKSLEDGPRTRDELKDLCRRQGI